jgi:hypothetical protein
MTFGGITSQCRGRVVFVDARHKSAVDSINFMNESSSLVESSTKLTTSITSECFPFVHYFLFRFCTTNHLRLRSTSQTEL